jgi:prolyl-tRNA synthetase
VHVIPVAVRDAGQVQAAERLAVDLESAGFEVLLDDRDERAGVKFKDADLLGVPIRVTVGNALAKEGVVEVRDRAARSDRRVPLGEAVSAVSDLARARAGEAPPRP